MEYKIFEFQKINEFAVKAANEMCENIYDESIIEEVMVVLKETKNDELADRLTAHNYKRNRSIGLDMFIQGFYKATYCMCKKNGEKRLDN